MNKIEEANLKRNEAWTKQSLSHTNWNNQPIVEPRPIIQSNAVEVALNLDDGTEPKLFKGKSATKRANIKSPFADTTVVNSFSGF